MPTEWMSVKKLFQNKNLWTLCDTGKPKWRQNSFISIWSIETSTSGFWKVLGTYWYFSRLLQTMAELKNLWQDELYILNLFYTIILNSALDLCYFRHIENDVHWSLSCLHWKILQQTETLCQCLKCSFHQMWECLHHFVILTFFIVVFNYYIPFLHYLYW